MISKLWKRIVFNIAISNCDDHLRNHGFLLSQNGWTLAPAYDLNPVYYGNGLSLNINEHSNALDFDLAIEVAPFFGITAHKAAETISSTKFHVATWRKWASYYHISREEQEQMKPAFRLSFQ
jgi:serine/threonine-protein kinase HipA